MKYEWLVVPKRSVFAGVPKGKVPPYISELAGTGRIPLWVTTLYLFSKDHQWARIPQQLKDRLKLKQRHFWSDLPPYMLVAVLDVPLDEMGWLIPEGLALFLDPEFVNVRSVFRRVSLLSRVDVDDRLREDILALRNIPIEIARHKKNRLRLYRFFGPEKGKKQGVLSPKVRARLRKLCMQGQSSRQLLSFVRKHVFFVMTGSRLLEIAKIREATRGK